MDDEAARTIADDLADWVCEIGPPDDVIPHLWDLLTATAPRRARRPRRQEPEPAAPERSVLPLFGDAMTRTTPVEEEARG